MFIKEDLVFIVFGIKTKLISLGDVEGDLEGHVVRAAFDEGTANVSGAVLNDVGRGGIDGTEHTEWHFEADTGEVEVAGSINIIVAVGVVGIAFDEVEVDVLAEDVVSVGGEGGEEALGNEGLVGGDFSVVFDGSAGFGVAEELHGEDFHEAGTGGVRGFEAEEAATSVGGDTSGVELSVGGIVIHIEDNGVFVVRARDLSIVGNCEEFGLGEVDLDVVIPVGHGHTGGHDEFGIDVL